MKPIVTKWIIDFILSIISKVIEVSFRVILFILPLGLFLTLLQFRGKVSKVSSLSAYTTDNSVWQHIFPGFILVAINPDQFKGALLNKKENIQSWLGRNKYILVAISMLLIIVLVLLMYLKG